MIQPQIFGKFILLERVSVGGMAEVYRAKLLNRPDFERFFAIKRILPQLAADKEFVQMFINEAKVAVELEHPNVCQIFELGRLGQSHYIAMEYIAGRDVHAIQNYYRQQKKIMSVSQACFIIAQAAQGLDYAHRAVDSAGHPLGLIHRDVSPQNLLVTYDGVVKLIDFGVSKASQKTQHHSKSGVIKGKFSYLSPEQAREAEIDHRSDIFALGIIFWELLTGRRLFQADSELALIEMIGECHIEKPSKYNRMIPDSVEKICLKALEKDISKRYSYASEMVSDLLDFINSNKTPFTQWHLQNWMCSVFKESFEKEWEVLPIFNTLNTPEDIDIYISKHAEEIASSISLSFNSNKKTSEQSKQSDDTPDTPKSDEKKTPLSDANSTDNPKSEDSSDKASENSNNKSSDSRNQKIPGVKQVNLNASASGESAKAESNSITETSDSNNNSEDIELEPEGIAPTVEDPQLLRFKREEKKARTRKGLIAFIIVICVCFIASPALLLAKIIELPKPELNLPTKASLKITVAPEKSTHLVLRKCQDANCSQKDLPEVKSADGINVTFDDLEAGTYRIDADMPNYRSESFTIKLENGTSETRLDMPNPIPQETEYQVQVTPEDARIYINDELLSGTGTRSVKALVGSSYAIRAVKPGFKSQTLTGNVEPDMNLNINLNEQEPVTIEIMSYPSHSTASLFVNGRPMRRTETPVTFDNIDPSQTIAIEVMKQGFQTYRQNIDFSTLEDNKIRLFADLKSP